MPKRQHYVPKAYLERFSANGKVLVRWRDGKIYSTNPVNVALEGGMYDIPTASGRSSIIDDALTHLEGTGEQALKELDAIGRPPPAGSELRMILSVLLAVQIARVPESRERADFPARVVKYLDGRPLSRELVAEFLEQDELHFKPHEREVEGAFTMVELAMQDPSSHARAEGLERQFGSIVELAFVANSMQWSLEFDRKRRLITSDSPVAMWRTPTHEDAYRGFGINNAEEVRFPLDPGKILVLTHRPRAVTSRMSGVRARDLNTYAAAACYRFVIGRPDRQAAIQDLRLARHRPVNRFWVGLGFTETPNGKLVRMEGEIVQFWTPRSDLVPPPPPTSKGRRGGS
jgi:hypothetical protein